MVEELRGRRAGGAWSVAGLVGAVAALLEQGFSARTVSGEISGFSRAASGHCYFTPKDPGGSATLRCAMFRRAAAPPRCSRSRPPTANGSSCAGASRCTSRAASCSSSPRRCRTPERARCTSASCACARGSPPRACSTPPRNGRRRATPRAIGVVTSLAGAALHDVATTLARRSPHVRVVVYPSVVQGSDAPAALCAAIAAAGARNEVDVLIVCRGGGSLEDLWAFNDERVVRAIRAAPMHVVSGVGHEPT